MHPYLSEGEVNELSEKFAVIAETDMASLQDNVVIDEAPGQIQTPEAVQYSNEDFTLALSNASEYTDDEVFADIAEHYAANTPIEEISFDNFAAGQKQDFPEITDADIERHTNKLMKGFEAVNAAQEPLITETTPQEVGQAIAEFTRGGFQHVDDVSEDTIFSKVASLELENADLQRGDNFDSVRQNNTAVEQLLVIAALEGSEDPRAVNALNSVNYDMNILAETPVPTQSYWSVEDQDDIHVGSDRERQLQSILDSVTEKRELETVLADRYNEALDEPNPDVQSKEIAKLTLDLDELRQEQRMDDYWSKRHAVEHDHGLEM